jgi:hypothetical protein
MFVATVLCLGNLALGGSRGLGSSKGSPCPDYTDYHVLDREYNPTQEQDWERCLGRGFEKEECG